MNPHASEASFTARFLTNLHVSAIALQKRFETGGDSTTKIENPNQRWLGFLFWVIINESVFSIIGLICAIK